MNGTKIIVMNKKYTGITSTTKECHSSWVLSSPLAGHDFSKNISYTQIQHPPIMQGQPPCQPTN
jgi:hypothetical protein